MQNRDERGRIVPRRIFATEELDRRFWRDGFVVVDLLPPEVVEEIAACFERLTPDDEFAPGPEQVSRYHCTFLDPNKAYRREVDELVRRTVGEAVTQICPGYRILTSNFYVKQPGFGRFEVHLNWPTITDLEDTTLTFWVPVQPMRVENGTVRMVRGSHKLYPDAASATSAQYFARFHGELIADHLEPVELDLGQVLIFDDTMIHWSDDNRSDRPRASIQVEIVPTDATTALWVLDPDDDRWFTLYAMDTDFWLTQDKEAFYGAPDLPRIARVPNANREVTYEEFCDRLAHADEIRRAAYVLPDET